jgi:hypothetical protein
MSAAPKDKDRCEFMFEDGRRCRRLRVASDAPFCRFHMRQFDQEEKADAAGDDIVAANGALDSDDAVHKALGNVFRQLAHNRIPARNAAVLGYIGQLMMGKCPSVERMLQSYVPLLQFVMKAQQHTDRSQAHADRHERHLVELQFDLMDRILLILRSDEVKHMSVESRREIAKIIQDAYAKKEEVAGAKV